MPVTRTIAPARKIDPLDELVLPAVSVAERMARGDRSSSGVEKTLGAAVLVLAAERESIAWMIRERVAELDRVKDGQKQYVAALEEELGPAGVDRVRGYLRLTNRTGVAGDYPAGS